jgi:hypothetical protein
MPIFNPRKWGLHNRPAICWSDVIIMDLYPTSWTHQITRGAFHILVCHVLLFSLVLFLSIHLLATCRLMYKHTSMSTSCLPLQKIITTIIITNVSYVLRSFIYIYLIYSILRAYSIYGPALPCCVCYRYILPDTCGILLHK